MTAVLAEQETVTFYHSAGRDANGRQCPSSMVVRISGGERMMGQNGIPTRTKEKEAKFHNGVCQTDDQETIAMLRKLMKTDPSITENYELYCDRVLTQEQRLRRQGNRQEAILAENSRLKAKLAEMEANESGKKK